MLIISSITIFSFCLIDLNLTILKLDIYKVGTISDIFEAFTYIIGYLAIE
jgi:hypothetical protein